MEAVYKSGGPARQATATEGLSLDHPSIVILKLAPESVARFERRGGDLVLVLHDGKEVAVPGFFAEYPDGGRNDLVLEDAAGVYWWGQYHGPWTEFHFTEIESTDPAAAAWWPWAALGLLGLGAAAGSGGGGSGSQNHAPTVTNQSLTTQEDTSISGKVSASDADGDSLSYAKASDPSHGTVTVNADGSYTYTPAENYSGTDSFTVTVSDGQGGTTTATVTVTVEAVNDAPVAASDTAVTDERTTVTGSVLTNDSDVDGDTLTVATFTVNGETYAAGTSVTIDGVGTLEIDSDGSYTFTPADGYSGEVLTVAYTISDGNGGTDTADLTITVNDTTAPSVTVEITTDANDDGTLSSSELGTSTTATATFTLSSDAAAGDTLSYTVSDGTTT
ncbi:MAG: Ig-like domain-containing protein, partial [Xenophilus sp.]